MNYKFSKNIQVFFMAKEETGMIGKFLDSAAKKGAEAINEVGNLIGLLGAKLIKANSKAEIDTIIKEQGEKLNNSQKQCIYALYETGEIGVNIIGGDTSRGAKKFKAISDAIDMSTNEPHIIIYSNGNYETVSVQKYKNDTDGKPEKLNTNIVQGILKTATQTGSSQIYEKYLTRRTLQDLALYLQGRGYNSRLIPKGVDVKNMMEGLAKEKKDAEKAKIDPLFQNIREKFGNTPEIMSKLELLGASFGIPISSGGEFQIDSYIKGFFSQEKGKEDEGRDIKDLGDKIKLIEGGVDKMIKGISTERDILIKKLGGDKFSLSESKVFGGDQFFVKDSSGKNVNVSKASLLTLTKNQAQEVLTQISTKINGNKLDQETINIILFLGLHSKLSTAQGVKAQLKTTQEAIKKGEIKTVTDSTTGKKSIQIDKKLTAQLQVSQKSAELAQNTKDTQTVVGKISPQDAQEKLKKLNPESQEAVNLRQYLSTNSEAVKQYKLAVVSLGKDDAEKIFTQNYREVIGNKNIKIDSEKAMQSATLTDPESTPGEKNLARMEPGQTLSMDKFMIGDTGESSLAYSPEVASIEIQMNPDRTYNIPLLKETHLTEDQVREYRTNISLYANIGLSQFIPHIPTITEELRKKGINTSMDGSTGTGEQQKVLKEIYTLLFGKKLETTNLGDVERAFGSSLGNPENIKNAIQHTLKVHKLIGESGQPIAADTLKNWIRSSNEVSQSTIDPLESI